MEQKENIILKLSFEFSLEIIEFTEILEEKKKFVWAKQIAKTHHHITTLI